MCCGVGAMIFNLFCYVRCNDLNISKPLNLVVVVTWCCLAELKLTLNEDFLTGLSTSQCTQHNYSYNGSEFFTFRELPSLTNKLRACSELPFMIRNFVGRFLLEIKVPSADHPYINDLIDRQQFKV